MSQRGKSIQRQENNRNVHQRHNNLKMPDHESRKIGRIQTRRGTSAPERVRSTPESKPQGRRSSALSLHLMAEAIEARLDHVRSQQVEKISQVWGKKWWLAGRLINDFTGTTTGYIGFEWKALFGVSGDDIVVKMSEAITTSWYFQLVRATNYWVLT